MGPDQFYPPSAGSQMSAPFGHDTRSPRSGSLSGAPHLVPGRGPVPKFQKVKSVHELQPHINAQPPYRRANPEGGFISVRGLLKIDPAQAHSRTAAPSVNVTPSGHLSNMQPGFQL